METFDGSKILRTLFMFKNSVTNSVKNIYHSFICLLMTRTLYKEINSQNVAEYPKFQIQVSKN